jgi:type II secretory pathway pseudopilin PulG
MVVIAIIGILIGLLMTGLWHMRIKARQTQCQSQMSQLHKALMLYRIDYEYAGNFMPYRLSHLIRSDMPYAGTNPKILLCPFDFSAGQQGGKPPKSASQFCETDEPCCNNASCTKGHSHVPRPGEKPCSYMYEFSGAACTWDWKSIGMPPYFNQAGYDGAAQENYFDTDHDGIVSWGEVKWKQMDHGDSFLHPDLATYNAMSAKGYPPSCFPIIRCFWHQANPDSDTEKDICNQSFEGRWFLSGALWETTLKN